MYGASPGSGSELLPAHLRSALFTADDPAAAVLWLRDDLHFAHNALFATAAAARSLLPVYVFTPQDLGAASTHRTLYGTPKSARGSGLLARMGDPASMLAEVVAGP